MNRFSAPLILLLLLAIAAAPPTHAQEVISGPDRRFPELANPKGDAVTAIRRRDFRFMALDPKRRDVPGLGANRRLKKTYRTKLMKQRLRLFASQSADFSYDLRARAYAQTYNETLRDFLLAHPPKK